VGIVIDGLINNGEIGATLFQAFFTAVQAIADAVFAGIGGIVGTLPMADELDFEIPSGVILGYALVNGFFPLDLTIQLGAAYIGALVAIFAFRLAVLVYHLIPKPMMGT
jgi:hypothetical protein